jgi:hypothetical protein
MRCLCDADCKTVMSVCGISVTAKIGEIDLECQFHTELNLT